MRFIYECILSSTAAFQKIYLHGLKEDFIVNKDRFINHNATKNGANGHYDNTIFTICSVLSFGVHDYFLRVIQIAKVETVTEKTPPMQITAGLVNRFLADVALFTRETGSPYGNNWLRMNGFGAAKSGQ